MFFILKTRRRILSNHLSSKWRRRKAAKLASPADSTEKMFHRQVSYDSDEPETQEQYKKRWTSIRLVYLTMFFDSLSFSLVLASLWPYLQKVSKEPELNPVYVGWAGVSFHITGIVVDFVMGYWTNKRGSMEPLLVSLLIFGFGNFLYGYAEAFGENGVTVIIISRGIIGLSTGVNVIARAALSDSTTLKERTTALAHMSVLQGIGFAFGPAVQLLTIPLGDKGIYLPSLKLNLNLYTAPAFASTFIAMLNVLLIITYYYEFHVNIYKDSEEDADVANFKALMDQKDAATTSYDKIAVVVILVLYFIAQSAFALYETILPPLTMDMLSWTREETALYASILFLSAGIIAIFTFAISELLEKISSDRLILFIGFVLIFLGFAIHLPWGNDYPALKTSMANRTQNGSSIYSTGCPEDYDWCKTSPKIYLPQIITGTVFVSIGYPFVMVFTSAMYSKVLGPGPQGLMQSWFGAIGGMSRITAPVLVTYLYVEFGPRWTFISVDSLVVLSMLIFLVTYQRLLPFHMFVLKKNTKLSEANNNAINGNNKNNNNCPNRKIANNNMIINIEQYVTRPNRWSLIDRGSYYSEESIII